MLEIWILEVFKGMSLKDLEGKPYVGGFWISKNKVTGIEHHQYRKCHCNIRYKLKDSSGPTGIAVFRKAMLELGWELENVAPEVWIHMEKYDLDTDEQRITEKFKEVVEKYPVFEYIEIHGLSVQKIDKILGG